MYEPESTDMLFEGKKLYAVLQFLKVRVPWAKICELYEKWEDTYKEDHYKTLGLEDLRRFSDVFFFKQDSIVKCRNELIYFLRNHQEFYNDDPAIVFNRMQEARDEFNQERENQGAATVPFINWIPNYGGIIAYSRNRAGAETNWHKINEVEFALDGFVIPIDDE